jgi:hypothetical protein
VGLIENLKIIKNDLPEFFVYLSIGNDVPKEVISLCEEFENVKINRVNDKGPILMAHRFFPIDDNDVEIMFSRDIDSRINYRDIWTMNEFIKSDKKFHTVRDHFWHKNLIMGGIFGIKKQNFKMRDVFYEWRTNIAMIQYGSDELFLKQIIYPLIKDDVLIHSNINGYLNETITKIDAPLINDGDFIGNVIDYDKDNKPFFVFYYSDYPFIEQFDFLRSQNQWSLMIIISEKIDISNFDVDVKNQILYNLFMANFYIKSYDGCVNVLKSFETTNTCVTEDLIYNSSFLLKYLNKVIVATTDINRKPKQNEIIIIYGNFNQSFNNLPINNIIYRHPKHFGIVNHNVVEFDSCWNEIDQIYILNLLDRHDKYLEILLELCKMNAPLNKIYHYKAKNEVITGNKQTDTFYNVRQNHIEVVKDFIEKKYKHCLILEDDVTFTSNIKKHKKGLRMFFSRKYDFDICLITSSVHGKIAQYDDLLSLSYQCCVSSSGYILNANAAPKILDVLEEGNRKLLETHDVVSYACDKYWIKIQKDNKFFLFNKKIGYVKDKIFNHNSKYHMPF